METYYGHLQTPQDALLLVEATKQDMLPRIHRRLSLSERGQIRSGDVFIWEENEAGMRRWTDGRRWSPSRVGGVFLTYRELEGDKRLDKARSQYREFATDFYAQQSNYKPHGLIKQSFSTTTQTNQRYHIIAYYTKKDILGGRLINPESDPRFSGIVIPQGMYPELMSLALPSQYMSTYGHNFQSPHYTAPPNDGNMRKEVVPRQLTFVASPISDQTRTTPDLVSPTAPSLSRSSSNSPSPSDSSTTSSSTKYSPNTQSHYHSLQEYGTRGDYTPKLAAPRVLQIGEILPPPTRPCRLLSSIWSPQSDTTVSMPSTPSNISGLRSPQLTHVELPLPILSQLPFDQLPARDIPWHKIIETNGSGGHRCGIEEDARQLEGLWNALRF
ncbi:hypothetical protein BZG36_01639 [Bifiguratus adelaidae]|uniref:cAMP-independent regulatory protein pac2 n=1 Tax=Bifiguratus adelaidae TaxID=1938954 RepID=A0A261Y496_9FUNG|nr:hypothetical protein BZG36_01639 [Bifiguratus adelaidae]